MVRELAESQESRDAAQQARERLEHALRSANEAQEKAVAEKATLEAQLEQARQSHEAEIQDMHMFAAHAAAVNQLEVQIEAVQFVTEMNHG